MLSHSPDTRGADWVVAGISRSDFTVGSIVPAVFDAYARVFHPAERGRGDEAVEVRWAHVAGANGRLMHPAAEWGSLTGSWQSDGQPGVWDEPPSEGTLPHALASRLADVLAGHTERSQQSCFALWEGWGVPEVMVAFRPGNSDEGQRDAHQSIEAEIASWRGLIGSAPRFKLSTRGMLLLRGPLAAVEDFYAFHRDPPSMWWPEDHTWCVATDIDLMTTYIGGSTACINALLADEQLEVLAVPVDQLITWEADTP
jgi:hypothetical protein